MSKPESISADKSSAKGRPSANSVLALQDEVNKLFHRFFGELSLPRWGGLEYVFPATTPVLDVVENDKEFKITVELPGIEIKDIDISASDSALTIKGEKRQLKKEESSGYYHQERSYGAFQRVVTLPGSANLDKIDAQFKNGVLTLQVAKKAKTPSKTRKVPIA